MIANLGPLHAKQLKHTHNPNSKLVSKTNDQQELMVPRWHSTKHSRPRQSTHDDQPPRAPLAREWDAVAGRVPTTRATRHSRSACRRSCWVLV
jgi:hypothetical protein